ISATSTTTVAIFRASSVLAQSIAALNKEERKRVPSSKELRSMVRQPNISSPDMRNFRLLRRGSPSLIFSQASNDEFILKSLIVSELTAGSEPILTQQIAQYLKNKALHRFRLCMPDEKDIRRVEVYRDNP
ncbi:7580_t:CDS:2, partial [Ambispora leptoticha]